MHAVGSNFLTVYYFSGISEEKMVSYRKYKMYLSTLKAICQQYICTKNTTIFSHGPASLLRKSCIYALWCKKTKQVFCREQY